MNLSAAGELRTTQQLDREKDDQQTLTFTVWARDSGSPPRVTSLRVQVDVQGANEETPQVCRITRQQQPDCGHNISLTAFSQAPEGNDDDDDDDDDEEENDEKEKDPPKR